MGRDNETTVFRTPFGQAAVHALEEALTAAKGADPMAPVTIVPPSQAAGLHVRRRICSEKGMVNVRFMPLGRLAELLAGARLAERGARRAGPMHQLEAARVALNQTDGPFQEHGDSPQTIQAVARAVAGLERPERDALAGSDTPRARAVVDLWDAWHASLGQNLTADEVAEAASVAVREGTPALRDIGRVVLYLPKRLTLGQRALCEALREKELLLEVLGEPQEPEVEGMRLFVAGDPEEECRAVVREVGALMESGTPLYRIGVLFAASDPYASLMEEQLDTAGMPHNGAESRRLGHSGPGRCLRLFLELAGGKLERRKAMALLAAGSTFPADTVSAWELMARDADIVRGLPVWESRLGAKGSDDAKALLDVVRFLAEHGSRSSESWSQVSEWLAGALVRLRGPASQDSEAAPRAAVDEAVARLGDLDAIGGSPTRTSVQLAAENLLGVPAGQGGRYGDGVFLGRPESARGLEFDAVFLLGMTDGVFPAPQRDDPIVPRSERLLAGLPAEPLGRAREDEREGFLAARASAPRVWMGFPKVDRRAGRENMPATWLLEQVGAVAGHPAYATNFVELARSAGVLESSPSYEATLREAAAGSAQERDLQELLAAKDAGQDLASVAERWREPGLAAGFRAAAAHALPEMTEYDGRVQPVEGVTLPAVHSPSGLEQYAKCPNAYFLGWALRVKETRDFREDVRLEPRKLGEAVHEALRRFYEENRDAKWSEAKADRLEALVREEFAKHYGTPDEEARPAVDREIGLVARRMRDGLSADAAYRAEAGTVPSGFEVKFGADRDVWLDLGGDGVLSRVGLCGKVDRIDLSREMAVAIDYKTGSVQPPPKDDQTRKGERLQGLVYAYYLSQQYPQLKAAFIYMPVGKRKETAIQPEEPGAGLLEGAVGAIVGPMSGGWFPARPGNGCQYCAFADACPADRGALWQLKGGAAELKAYREWVKDAKATNEEENEQ